MSKPLRASCGPDQSVGKLKEHELGARLEPQLAHDVCPGPTTASTAVCPTIGYGREEVWNEPFLPSASGGAASLLFSAPSYQNGDGSGATARTTPDISYDAAPSGAVLVYLSFPGIAAGYYIFGGTSAGLPRWPVGCAKSVPRLNAGREVPLPHT
jgi:hypothetical protein